jgi:hypothetical protein
MAKYGVGALEVVIWWINFMLYTFVL